MSVVILDGTTDDNPIENNIKKLFDQSPEEINYFKLKNMNILPCRSCGSCGYNTPGRCVLKDEMTKVLEAIAKSKVLTLVTPIKFGGYSSQLKKAVDRFMPLGLPFFTVKEGHLLHPMRYEDKFLVGVGLSEENQQTEIESFKTLVARNALNTQYPHKSVVFKAADDTEKIYLKLQEIYSEVS